MYTDKIIKAINKTVNSLNNHPRELNPPFEIPKRALIVLPNYIGDVVLLTPIFRNLRFNFGQNTVIDVICSKSIRNLIETLPYIDYIFLNDSLSQDRATFLKIQEYDTVFLFNFPILWALASYQARINQRISFNLNRIGLDRPPIWENLITHFVESTPINDKKPQWKVYLDTLNTLGLKVFNEYTEIILTNDDYYKAKSIMQNIPKPRASMHISAGSPGKHWKLSNWITVIKHLRDKYNYNFIAVGTKNDKAVYDYLSDHTGITFYNLCGETTIRETTALYQYLDLVITIDTSSAHLAASANTKNIIVLYGPTNESQWMPYAPNSNIHQICLHLPCRPCLTRLCHHRDCLNKLHSNQVIDIIDKIS